MSSDQALIVDGLSFSYKDKKALDSISFELNEGMFLALLGPNGAGKSTLFALLTNLLKPQSGSISYSGTSLHDSPRTALRKMGIVFQQSTLDLDLSVAQNLFYHASLHGMSRNNARQQIQIELKRLHLEDLADKKVRLLNGGHRRRVEIARALLHQPKILLLDEATVGLDIETRSSINQHVRSLCREEGIAVLWATHLIEEIEAEDSVIMLHKGKRVAYARCQELLAEHQQQELGELFNQLTGAAA